MRYYIYILYSSKSAIYYVGYTCDFERRLIEHNNVEHNTFTSKHRPWMLAAVFYCGDLKSEAIKIEQFIKRQKSRVLLEKMIRGETLTGMLAQLVRVPHVRD